MESSEMLYAESEAQFIFSIDEVYGLINDVKHTFFTRFGVRPNANQRMVDNAIELLFDYMLKDRLHPIFSDIPDDWEIEVLCNLFGADLLVDGVESESVRYDILVRISRLESFKNLLRNIREQYLTTLWKSHSPQFTKYTVSVEMGCITIVREGDYRIMQWHKDYGVANNVDKTNISLDMRMFCDYVKRKLSYNEIGSYVSISYTHSVPKKEWFTNIMNHLYRYVLFGEYESNLSEMISLKGHQASILEDIRNYFKLEYQIGLNKLLNGKRVQSFTVGDNSLYLEIGNQKDHSRNMLTKHELELRVAEANGDYVPPRLRLAH